MVPFKAQMFLILIKSNFSIFYFMDHAFSIVSLLTQGPKEFFLFYCGTFIQLALTFQPMRLIFVYGGR